MYYVCIYKTYFCSLLYFDIQVADAALPFLRTVEKFSGMRGLIPKAGLK